MDSEDGSFLRSLREPTSDKSIGRGSDQDIALPPRLATVSRRFWVYLGLLFHNPVEERVFLRTLSSSRIKSGLTICFFLLARQFILMMHMTPAGVDAGCRSQETHAVSGYTFICALLLTAHCWLVRRLGVRALLSDVFVLFVLASLQIGMLAELRERRPRVLATNQTFLVATDDQAMWASESCSSVDVVAIRFAMTVFISFVIGCGFCRACLSWIIAVVWLVVTLAEANTFFPTGKHHHDDLHTSIAGVDLMFDQCVVPIICWLLSVGFETARRAEWQRTQTVNQQLVALNEAHRAHREEKTATAGCASCGATRSFSSRRCRTSSRRHSRA